MANAKKKVFVIVPIEKGTDEDKMNAIQVAKEDYCKANNCKLTDVKFYDVFSSVQASTKEDEMKKIRGHKHESLIWAVDCLSLIAIGGIDQVVLGENWGRSRHCKTVEKACELYYIPQLRIMRMKDRREDVENDERQKAYKEKHFISAYWKQ